MVQKYIILAIIILLIVGSIGFLAFQKFYGSHDSDWVSATSSHAQDFADMAKLKRTPSTPAQDYTDMAKLKARAQ